MNHLAASITKNQILTEFYNSANLCKMLAKFDAGAGQQDLKSELFLVLCSQPEEKIQDLHCNNQLIYFATGIVQRMIFQKSGKFNRTYRKTNVEFNDELDTSTEDYDTERDQKETKVKDSIEKDLHWVESSMLSIYLEKGSIYRAAKATGISQDQVGRILKNARRKLKTGMEGKLIGNYIVGSLEIVLDVQENVNPENVLDIMDDVMEFIKYKLESSNIPSKSSAGAFIKEVKPFKITKIV